MNELLKKENDKMKFVDFIGQFVPTATYLQPGVLANDKYNFILCVTKELAGRKITAKDQLER